MITNEQLAQSTAEELRHCVDNFGSDGWGFNIAMAQDYLLRMLVSYSAELTEQVRYETTALVLGALLTQLTSGEYCRHDSRKIVMDAIEANLERAKRKEVEL